MKRSFLAAAVLCGVSIEPAIAEASKFSIAIGSIGTIECVDKRIALVVPEGNLKGSYPLSVHFKMAIDDKVLIQTSGIDKWVRISWNDGYFFSYTEQMQKLCASE